MKRKYSASEQHLLAILSEQPITTTALAQAHYGKLMRKRKAPQQTVTWTLHSLKEKIKENGEDFAVLSTKHAGPYEMQHWLVYGLPPRKS